jgi:hypothetical protein
VSSVPLPDGRVQQSTREAWSWDVVSGGVIVDQQPEITVVRHYTIARIDGVLRIVEHSFE